MKQIIQRLTLGLAALLLLALPLEAGQKYFTGIKGQTSLFISYGMPYEVAPGIFIGVPSVQLPVSVSFSVLSAKNGREVARGASDANGAFEVSLPPGKYIFVPDDLITMSGFPSIAPITVEPVEVTVRPKNATFISTVYFQNGPWSVFTATLLGQGE
jgi:hypothetical protein